jgi:P-type Ca2+ transporter type 2C
MPTSPATNPLSPLFWHTVSAEDVVKRLDTDVRNGLSDAEAARRLSADGRNELAAAQKISPWRIFLAQFQNILMLVLIAGIALSASLGHVTEPITIGVIVLFSTILGFLQEYRAERAIDALRTMAAPTATVIRDGEEHDIAAALLVRGDVILLSAGDRVPADARLIESVNLQTDEAPLTGESLPVAKITDVIADVHAAAGDRLNMIFAGTAVTYGRGTAVVTDTGMQTEFGRIAGLLQTLNEHKTPLQKNLAKIGRTLACAAGVIVIVIVGLGILRGEPFLEMVVFGIALAVAVVPEALPAVVTISLALGVQRMVKRHALIRRLPAVETLGGTSVICTDKTGTLTKDEMTVRQILTATGITHVDGDGYEPTGSFTQNGKEVGEDKMLEDLLRAAVLSSDAHLSKENSVWDIKGDPTEGALVVCAAKLGLHKHELDKQYHRIDEIPFTSEAKSMTTIHTTPDDKTLACAKGAPEVMLERCTHERTADGHRPLSQERRAEILAAAGIMAESALRVLAVASKENVTRAQAEEGLTFLGLFGMIDPPRTEAKQAIQTCRAAGIRPIMITGDHPTTALAIARELGLARDGDTAVTGKELDSLDERAFAALVEQTSVFARVSPVHKLRIVTALQAKGSVVAMTGDGVNDAPALKKADIGIAMGITGTDVSKEAADMMLTDDNFASIVAAVEEGRIIFQNIRKYLMYLISGNIAEICIMTISTALGLPLPLSAVQILYINLATDGLPALALAVDPAEGNLMKRPPRNPRHGVFTRPILFLVLVSALWATIINLGLFLWLLNSGVDESVARTSVFVLLTFTEFFKAYNCRSDQTSLFHHPFTNKWLNAAIVWEAGLLALILSVPLLRWAFDITVISWSDALPLLLLASTIVPVIEGAKWMIRRGWLGSET